MREQCLAYLKGEFLKFIAPGNTEPNNTEEEWDRMPDDHKQKLVDLVLGFQPQNLMMDEVMKEYNKKSHSDLSFGMVVKQIVSKHARK